MSRDIHEWLNDVSGPQWYWFVKILSGNDTLLNKTHQAGPYVPRKAIFTLFPSIANSRELNPRAVLPVRIDSHATETTATAIWYNNRVVADGSRNEARITGWGGRASPLLDPESTGSACVLAFLKLGERDAEQCRVWLCGTAEEEEALTNRVGSLEPGVTIFIDQTGAVDYYPARPVDAPCRISPADMPDAWRYNFPSAAALLERSIEHLPTARNRSPDERLLLRRECEFELFRSVEELVVLPRLRESFPSVDIFLDLANAVTNRRKARSGRSLELQTKAIFDEEDVQYSHNAESEGKKRPDFLFPSADCYHDMSWPPERLRMLAVKTTVKDRWRQVIDEASRLPVKHLLTLQHGVSPNQFAQMVSAGVRLVVPKPLHAKYPSEIQPQLLTVASFIADAVSCGPERT